MNFVEKQKPGVNTVDNKINVNRNYIIGNIIIALFSVFRCLYLSFQSDTYRTPTYIITIAAFQGIFFAMGWWFIAAYRDKLRKQRANCTQAVLATLVTYKVVVKSDGDGTTYTYYGKYEYNWNGNYYYTTSKVEYAGKREEGVQCKLLINPNAPEEIYEIEIETERIKQKRNTGIIILLFGCLFFKL